jgi:crotonobetainyl-CoA:carnitine CoA-transferase CaiB-like acyl-CoA transferase
MQHSKHAPFKMPAWPVRVDGKPARVKASPILGEHTADVLTGWLGMTDAEVAKLRDASVV